MARIPHRQPYQHTPQYRKGIDNRNADFLSRLRVRSTEGDHSDRNRLTTLEEEFIYRILSCDLVSSGSPTSGIGFGGMMPFIQSGSLGVLLPSTYEICDFRRHDPPMRIDDLDTLFTSLSARTSSPVFSRTSNRGCAANTRVVDDTATSVMAGCLETLP